MEITTEPQEYPLYTAVAFNKNDEVDARFVENLTSLAEDRRADDDLLYSIIGPQFGARLLCFEDDAVSGSAARKTIAKTISPYGTITTVINDHVRIEVTAAQIRQLFSDLTQAHAVLAADFALQAAGAARVGGKALGAAKSLVHATHAGACPIFIDADNTAAPWTEFVQANAYRIDLNDDTATLVVLVNTDAVHSWAY